MPAKQCSYCSEKAKADKSLVDQGWKAFVMNIGNKRIHKRACPAHHAELSEDMRKAFEEAGINA